MPTFDTLTQADAAALLRVPTLFDEVTDLVYRGDHWRRGAGFVGPTTAAERSAAEQNALRTGWQRRFVSENLLAEMTKRAADAVVGKEPHWTAELMRPLSEAEQEDPTSIPEDERLRLEEAAALMAEWWDGAHGIVTVYDPGSEADEGARQRVPVVAAMKALGRAVKAYGRAGLRLRVPAGMRAEDGTIKADDLAAALGSIFAEVVLPDAGRLYLDPATMQEAGIVTYEVADDLDAAKATRYAELSYLSKEKKGEAGDPLTVLRVTYTDASADYRQTFDLRGGLLYHEALHPAVVTPQMIELQKAYNTESTEMAIVLDQQGFPRTILSNTQGPGSYVVDTETGRDVFVPTPYTIGPGQDTYMLGEPVRDPATGEMRNYTTPGVHQVEAADVEGYLKGSQARRLAMLRQSRQLWTETTDDAGASGESRVQALVDFLQDAADFKGVMDGLLKRVLETVWFFALDLAGAPGRDHDLRFVVDHKITLPFIPAAMREALLKEREAGLRSDETTMTDLGIEDVEAELARIAESERQKLNKRKIQAEIMQAGSGGGMGLEESARFAMMPEEEIAEITRQDRPPRMPELSGDGQ